MTDLNLYYAIGSAIDSIDTFSDLGLDAPFQEPYNPYSVDVPAADSLVYGHGWPVTAWRWGYISQADRNTLKSYCAGKSAIVYIRIRDDDWNWIYCKAVMIWQPENPPTSGFILDFSIAFRILENYGSSLP